MSQRVKKPGRTDESQGKKKKRRPSGGSEGEEEGARSSSNSGGNGSLSGMWTPRHLSDLKVSSIYNRNSAEAPAELYRKDLISAMKLADSEPLTPEEYWLITDPWKQEWEKGVQVPVNPESLPEPEVVVIPPVAERSHDFRLPKKKYIRVTHDDFFNPDYHQLVSTAARAEKVCSYDLDDVDAAWLSCVNSDRVMSGGTVISQFLMEQVVEELELQCWEQVQTMLKSHEGLGIEYDENVICDVCRSPESEEGNEMVFCDSCNICVHQACYGITTIPSGSWLCRTCTLGIRPTCVLCSNLGGAMKATRSGHKWAHVACAIWIPEVSIGSVEKMEPITKISAIPQSRWSLVCVMCKEKTGACIQCSVKTCKTAYHVTCAFKNGLEMKPIIVDENAEDGIKLRSYCEKHSVNTKKDKNASSAALNSGSEDESTEKKKTRTMTAEERNHARAEKLQQIESEFYKYVRLKDVSSNLAVDMDIANLIYNYWKLKRRSLNNRPLVPPRPETTQLLTQQQEQDLEQMKMFVQLRQDLERVRNLCYMVSRREKLSRTFFRLKEQTFQKQVTLLTERPVEKLSAEERGAIMDANHGPSIYDRLYSLSNSCDLTTTYDHLISLIRGKPGPNGLLRKPKAARGAPKKPRAPKKSRFVNGTRTTPAAANAEEAADSSPKKSSKKSFSYLFGDSDSSSPPKSNSTNNRGAALKQMEKSLLLSSDSDDLEELPGKSEKSSVPIYSDSESESENPSSLPPTKGALKHFKKSPKKKGSSSSKVDPSALIVPQREAAKKATESIRSKKKESTPAPQPMIMMPPYYEEGPMDLLPCPSPVPQPDDILLLGTKRKGRRRDLPSVEELEEMNAPYVPQRQAAKKAAEHIRSGLSNIVAARLIIEDEMEASRSNKKKGAQGPQAKGGSKGGKAPPKEVQQRTSPRKGESGGRGGGGRSSRVRTPDWPFLDKGSQSTGELGREGGRSGMGESGSSNRNVVGPLEPTTPTTTSRTDEDGSRRPGRRMDSSDSSCESSSSSSCCSSSSSSSSSSRSSSPQSASPRQKYESSSSSGANVNSGVLLNSSTSQPLFTATRSEQEWNSHLHWSPPRLSTTHSRSRGESSAPPSTAERTKPSSTPSGGSEHIATRGTSSSLTPPTKRELEKETTSPVATHTTPHRATANTPRGLTTPDQEEKICSLSNTLVLPKNNGPNLSSSSSGSSSSSSGSSSSSSEDEDEKKPSVTSPPFMAANSKEPPPVPPPPPVTVVEASPSSKWKPLQPAAETATPPRLTATAAATPSRKRKESSPDLEEKENSCVHSSPLRQNVNPILSPLTLNKEPGFLSPKRARQDLHHHQAPGAGTGSGLFSPPKEQTSASDILDLYDLANSVVTGSQEDDEEVSNTPLSFSFSAALLSGEDNKEDSAMATLNLVEKLRSTIGARKSSTGPESGPSSPSLKTEDECLDELQQTKVEDEASLNFEGTSSGSVLPTATLPLPSSLQNSPLRAPMPSTVAQIIESVVNSHHQVRAVDPNVCVPPNPGAATATALSILQTLTTNSSNTSSSNSGGGAPAGVKSGPPTKTPLSVLNKGQPGSIVPPTATSASTSPWEARKEARSPLSRDQILEQVAPSEGQNVQQTGRGSRSSRDTTAPGKRGASPRIAAARATEKMKLEEQPEQQQGPPTGKGRGRPKEKGGSPRGRKPGGRGKGKKNFVGPVRKDLAGTVYDIDFDEFEENNEEKFEEFRMLRERRKSASSMDSHNNVNSSPAYTPGTPGAATKIEPVFGSPPLGLSSVTNVSSIPPHASPVGVSQKLGLVQPPPLPGPVDMRTYNPSVLTTRNNQSCGISPARGTCSNNLTDVKCSIDPFPLTETKDPQTDIASMLLSYNGNYAGTTSVTELEELDNALEALASNSATPIIPEGQSFIPSGGNNNINNVSGVNSGNSALLPPPSPKETGRNQLKVKIKGPFLDANYSCAPSVSPAPPPPTNVVSAGSVQMAAYMSAPSDANSSNTLRRMRKKELLRQYCAQDMNSDSMGASAPSYYHHTDSNSHHSAFAHQNAPSFNRSVITIPKAVASMTIIPTKEDYRMDVNGESPSGESGAFPFGGNGLAQQKDMGVGRGATGNNGGTTKKKRRSRGVSREMAALGLTPTGDPRTEPRRRDRNGVTSGSEDPMPEDGSNPRKRGRGPKTSTKLSTSTKGRSTFIPPTLEDHPNSVNSVSHPTPKLKIKFGGSSGDTSSRIVSGAPNGDAVDTNHNHVSDSEKETPSKKVKGRPPKKRGLSELTSSLPENNLSTSSTTSMPKSSGEELSSSNAPNAMEELKRQSMQFRERMMIQFENEGKSKAKKHKKKDKSKRGEKQVKVIEDGSKRLILRFGKAKESPPEAPGENVDSGFTGSSEGSSSSLVTEGGGASNNLSNNNTSSSGGDNNTEGAGEGEGEPMPIRLKLSRCFEGYALQRGDEGAGGGVATEKSSSCQVR